MSIINHVFMGTNDLQKGTAFYDAVLGALETNNLGPFGDTAIMYGKDKPEFILGLPANGEPATQANGGTLGFVAPSRAAVDQFHAAGLAAGGTCEGAPGPRKVAPTAYGAYLRDLDGNKICAFCFKPE